MAPHDNYVAVMTSEEHAWKLDIMGENPMGFLTRSPQSLLKFSDCIWIIQVAILNSAEPVDLTTTKQNVWRPRSVPALTRFRTLLLLKKKRSSKKRDGSSRSALWELPQDRILRTDATVQMALRRVVYDKTALTVKDIMGGFVTLVVLDSDPYERVQLKLFFAVTVEELPPSGVTGDVRVVPGKAYTDHRWIRHERDITTLSPVSPLHMPLLDRAWTFRPEVWQSPMEYLDQAISALPYTDRYDHYVAAIVTRKASDGVGRQLLLKCRQEDNGEQKWELPGGCCGVSDNTVEEMLHFRVSDEAGLHVKKVLGQLRAQPLVSSGWQEVGSRGVVVLPYEVSVERGAMIAHQDLKWVWVQTKEDIFTLRITRWSLKLIVAALDVVSTTSTSVFGGIAEQSAWRCEVM